MWMNLESVMQSEGSLLAFDKTDAWPFPCPGSYSQPGGVCRGRPFMPSPWTETVGPQLLPGLVLKESSGELYPGPRTSPICVCVLLCACPRGEFLSWERRDFSSSVCRKTLFYASLLHMSVCLICWWEKWPFTPCQITVWGGRELKELQMLRKCS